MANCKAAKVKNERQEQLLNTLKNNSGKSVSIKSLQDILGINYKTLWNDINAIKELDPNIVRTRGSVTYNGPSIVVLKPERYNDSMNNEGYKDPTASNAIKTTEPKVTSKSVPKPNEVWQVSSNIKGTELYYVLAVNTKEEYATCIEYKPNTEARDISIKLYSKPLKYFIAKSWGMPLSFIETIKSRLTLYLGLTPTVIEKKVEVPVEVKSNSNHSKGEYTREEVDALLDKQRADIYEECFKMLAKKVV